MKKRILCLFAILLVTISIFTLTSCKKNHKNNADNTPTTDTPTPTHTHTLQKGEAQAKTCVSDGWAEYEYCTSCSYTTKQIIKDRKSTRLNSSH